MMEYGRPATDTDQRIARVQERLTELREEERVLTETREGMRIAQFPFKNKQVVLRLIDRELQALSDEIVRCSIQIRAGFTETKAD